MQSNYFEKRGRDKAKQAMRGTKKLPLLWIKPIDTMWLRQESTFAKMHEALGLEVPELGAICSYDGLDGREGIWTRRHANWYAFELIHAPRGTVNEFKLVEVWANGLTAGAVGQIGTSADLQLWVTRMLFALNIIQLPDVKHKPPLSTWPPEVHKVFDGFVMLVRCRLRFGASATSSFTQSFGPAWCGVSKQEFKQGWNTLLETEHVAKTDQYLDPKTPFRAVLYRLVA